MTFALLVQSAIIGTSLGSIYILMALGLTLMFGMMHIINFAHGAVYMLGAFVIYYVFFQGGAPYFAAFVVAMVLLGAFGYLVERSVYRPIKGGIEPTLVALLALTTFLQAAGGRAHAADLQARSDDGGTAAPEGVHHHHPRRARQHPGSHPRRAHARARRLDRGHRAGRRAGVPPELRLHHPPAALQAERALRLCAIGSRHRPFWSSWWRWPSSSRCSATTTSTSSRSSSSTP